MMKLPGPLVTNVPARDRQFQFVVVLLQATERRIGRVYHLPGGAYVIDSAYPAVNSTFGFILQPARND